MNNGFAYRTRYRHGDTVYVTTISNESQLKKCHLCKGEGRVRFPGASRASICPESCFRGMVRIPSKAPTYTVYGPLTIGSVRTEATYTKSESDEGIFDNVLDSDNLGPVEVEVSYMCLETGVGSGQVHREERLHATREDAIAAAEAQGAVPKMTTDGAA